MSRYAWPHVGRAKSEGDDPGGRAGFMSRRRLDFDRDGALEAGRSPLRAPARPLGLPGAPFAPMTGRHHLWQPLGPMTVLHGDTIGTPRVTGRVDALAVHPAGNRLYAASANGGVWYSSDAGASWRSLGGFAPTLTAEINRPAQRNACGAIHVVFGATEADDDVYVGTGETNDPPGSSPDAQPGGALGGIGVLFAHGPAASAAPNPWSREAKNLLGAGVDRFAVEPGGTTVVAATKIGLLQRPNPAVPDNDWPRVAGTPFNTLTAHCTDVLWTAAAGAAPARLWVWVMRGDKAGLWVRDSGEVNFTKIATAGSAKQRGVLAASTPPSQIYAFNDRGEGNRPKLYQISSVAAAKPPAVAVKGVPDMLGDSGFYDIAIAVHPTTANRVVLGGKSFNTVSPDGTRMKDDGAIILGDVGLVGGVLTFGAPPTPSTMIGVGVHADVHDLKYSNAGARLWASGDGGVFRSDKPTAQVGFVPCNTGLAIVEANYIATHPTCEGHVVTGLQDNGVIVRASNGVWRNEGSSDGGGVVFDPLRPSRYIRQHFGGSWSSSDGTVKENDLLSRGGARAKNEDKKSAFYSTAAAIAHRRAPVPPGTSPTPDVGQIIVGTTRVWYTENFGAKWVTLPTGTDPLPADKKHRQDAFGEAITVCRWQSPEVAWILGEGRLMRYARQPGSDAGGGPGKWSRETIIKKGIKNRKDATSADGPIRDAAVWTDIAVNLDPSPGADQPPAQHGAKGAVYLGTIGKPDNAGVDTLWWFDGTSKWFKTGLRTDPTGVPAPVTAIVCDPDHPDEVYVGTTVGVWKGVRTQIGGANPAWTWAARVNGLPEAAVEDLAIFSNGGIRLLRAAIAARGAWELRLDTADVVDLTYVRAHADDLRYRGSAVEKQRDLVTARSWHGSPDVRPRRAPATVAAPASLPWKKTSAVNAEKLRRFQSALRAKTGDARVRPTGEWDAYFNEVLRDLGAPILPPAAAKVVGITKAFWDANMVPPFATAEPWGAGAPSEADLFELTEKIGEGSLLETSCSLPARAAKVDIIVHHRGLDPVDGANVRVTLLKWIGLKKDGVKRNDSGKWFGDDVPWTAAVNEVLNGASGATTKSFAAGWSFVGTTNATRRRTLAGQTLDAATSGIVTFDLDLTGLKINTVVLLVAVIRPAADIALAAAKLPALVLANPNVAVRSLHIEP